MKVIDERVLLAIFFVPYCYGMAGSLAWEKWNASAGILFADKLTIN